MMKKDNISLKSTKHDDTKYQQCNVELVSRKRELIHKPIFHVSPASCSREYFSRKLLEFRDVHKEFNTFLIDLYGLLVTEKDLDYRNLQLFIEDKAETNWISPTGGLFDIFIKLFNLCFSPEQAFKYIKECHELYLLMSNAEYKISDKPDFSIRRSTWDDKNIKFVEVDVLPKQEPENWDHYYWFKISTSLKVIEDNFNDISSEVDRIELICGYEKMHDTLMLFVNHQNKPFLRNVFNTAVKGLITNGYIKKIKTEQSSNWLIHYYDTDYI